MNSIQLISKINARIEDLASLSHEILLPNSNLSNIEKEVLKRTCSELFELMLKLKTSNDLSEEQIAIKENISQEIRKDDFSFKTIISNNSSEDNLTINSLANVSSEIMEAESEKEPILFPLKEPEIEIVNTEEVLETAAQAIELPAVVLEDNHEDIISDFNEPLAKEKTEQPFNFSFNFSEPKMEVIKETEIVENIEIEPTFINETEVISTIELEEEIIEPEIKEELPIDIQPIIVENKPIVIEDTRTKPAPFFSIGKTVLPQSESQSLNEKIAQKLDEFQFSEKIVEPKIDSLKTAISLNKKIAFVNELFKENVVEYAKSIDKINSSANLDDALLIWNELKIVHNWNSENMLVKDLEKLINRRFN